MRRLPHPFKIQSASMLCGIAACIVIAVAFRQDGFAQTIQFSSSGTANNFDSLYEGFMSKNKFRFNSTSIRSKTGDSLTRSFNGYRGKYNNSLDQSSAYQSKYGEQLDQFKKYRSRYDNGLNKALNQYRSTSNLNRLKSSRSNLPEKYEKYQASAVEAASLADQLLAGKCKLDSSTIFNSKIMQKYMDSINRTLPARPTVPFKQVSKQDLLKEVDQQFRPNPKNLMDSIQLDEQAKKGKEWADLNYTRLKNEDGSDLKPMATRLVTKKVLDNVDSLNKIDLKASGMRMKQIESSSKETITRFRKIESFWQKSYLEAVLSLFANPNGTAQFSPAWAYHIIPSWSIGAGPNVLITRHSSDFKLDVGARVLTKYEMLHRTVYLQVEDKITPNSLGKENLRFTQQSLMAGGGYVVPFLSPVTINLSLMYRFYSNVSAMNEGSAWLFRIGVSTRKKQQ